MSSVAGHLRAICSTETVQLLVTKHWECFLGFSPYILLTLCCRCAGGVSSGAFGVSLVSAPSVPGGIGGRPGSFSQAGSQRRQRRQGCRHPLVVVHPRNTRSQSVRAAAEDTAGCFCPQCFSCSCGQGRCPRSKHLHSVLLVTVGADDQTE